MDEDLDNQTPADEHRAALDRRGFLRKAGIATATGVTAPLLVDSILSPAAACSGPNIQPTVRINNLSSTADNQSSYATGAFAVQPTSLILIAFVLHWFEDDNTTSNDRDPNVTVTDNNAQVSTPALVQRIRFDPTTAGSQTAGGGTSQEHTFTLFVYQATASATATGTVTITITLDDPSNPGTGNFGDGFIGHVVQLRDSVAPIEPVVVSGSAANRGNGTAASVTLAPAGDEGTFLVVANRTTTSISTISWTSSLTEQTDQFLNDGNFDLSLATYFSTSGVTNPSATSTASLPWGAVGVRLNC